MTFTEFITYLFIGIGLSFDSFAVAVSCGLMKPEMRFKNAAVIAFSLAFFQGAFPVLGWLVGNSLKDLIIAFDHWIAFCLLAFLGTKMIIEGVKENGTLANFNPFQISVLIGLSIATSIDALVVGVSYGFLDMPILFPVIVIGFVTFVASMLGMLFGKYIPAKRSHQSLIIGGVILIAIGLKILVEHLWI